MATSEIKLDSRSTLVRSWLLSIIFATAAAALVGGGCGGGDDATPAPTLSREPAATMAPATRTPRAASPTPTLELEDFTEAVLSVAPGYVEEEPSEEDWAGTEEEFATLFGDELEQYAVLKFGNGDGALIAVGFADAKEERIAVLINDLQGSAGLSYADTYVAGFEETGIIVNSKQEVPEALELGEGGWGFTAQLEGGGLGITDQSGGNAEFMEIADQPVTVLFFARSNLVFKVTALFDPQVNALAIARALDAAVAGAAP